VVTVRPARLDRPLREGGAIDPAYTDPALEEMVRVAAEQARESARAEGYAAGWAQGRQAALVRATAENDAVRRRLATEKSKLGQDVAELLTALAEATRAARTAQLPDWIEVADVLAAGALQLAAAALGRELSSVDGAVEQAVAGALRHLAEPGDAVVHLNPAEAEMVDGLELGVRVIPDPSVATGSVVVLTPAQRLRHDLPAALAAAEEVLRS
jgi:flagellar assembly protein FliH